MSFKIKYVYQLVLNESRSMLTVPYLSHSLMGSRELTGTALIMVTFLL